MGFLGQVNFGLVSGTALSSLAEGTVLRVRHLPCSQQGSIPCIVCDPEHLGIAQNNSSRESIVTKSLSRLVPVPLAVSCVCLPPPPFLASSQEIFSDECRAWEWGTLVVVKSISSGPGVYIELRGNPGLRVQLVHK